MEKTHIGHMPKKLPKYLGKDAIDAVLERANRDNNKHGRRNYIMLLALWRTGMRVSDLVHLRKSDIKEDTINIRDGKGAKGRIIPLSFDFRALLLTYADSMDKDAILFPLKCRQVNNIIKKYDPSMHAHLFRHSFSYHYVKSGGSIRALQKILGHTDLATTSIYLDLVSADLVEDYAKIKW